jgi:hypothetical protein
MNQPPTIVRSFTTIDHDEWGVSVPVVEIVDLAHLAFDWDPTTDKTEIVDRDHPGRKFVRDGTFFVCPDEPGFRWTEVPSADRYNLIDEKVRASEITKKVASFMRSHRIEVVANEDYTTSSFCSCGYGSDHEDPHYQIEAVLAHLDRLGAKVGT